MSHTKSDLIPRRLVTMDGNGRTVDAVTDYATAYHKAMENLLAIEQKHTALLAAIDEVIAQNGLTLLAKEQLIKARNV